MNLCDFTTRVDNVSADERLWRLCVVIGQHLLIESGPAGGAQAARALASERRAQAEATFAQSEPALKRDRIRARIARTQEGQSGAVSRKEMAEAALQSALAADDETRVAAARKALTQAVSETTAFEREMQLVRELERDAEHQFQLARQAFEESFRQTFRAELQERVATAHVQIIERIKSDEGLQAAVSEFLVCLHTGQAEQLGLSVGLATIPPERVPGLPAPGEAVNLSAGKGPALVSVAGQVSGGH